MGINKVIATGNLTRDPELRSTAGGCPVLVFGLAVNERRRDPSGEWMNEPVFIDCTLFGARGEALYPCLQKGSKVAVEGRMHQSKWKDKDTGRNRTRIELILQEIDLGGKRREENEARGGDSPETATLYGEDIPF